MNACRAASVVAFAALGAPLAIAACRDASAPSASAPTAPKASAALASSALASAALAPSALASSVPSSPASSSPASAPSLLAPSADPPPDPPSVAFAVPPRKLTDGLCQTLLLANAKGSLSAYGKTLAPGDVLVVAHALPDALDGTGLAVEARTRIRPCPVRSRPAPEITVIRGASAPKLAWAGGTMSAHLDVPSTVSPTLYLGRLEGTAGVAEHAHPGSWEILAAIDAAGTFSIEGREGRLGPNQIVVVPPGAKHAWKPDAGATLVAVQLYAPPGPEQRFRALADAGL